MRAQRIEIVRLRMADRRIEAALAMPRSWQVLDTDTALAGHLPNGRLVAHLGQIQKCEAIAMYRDIA
ncbi:MULTISPECIES: hypothetical protein [Burkholderia]|uniref:hypothetical protein n=1 Tax=Burkholderia TaxID=32008 RepID=UPI00158240D9